MQLLHDLYGICIKRGSEYVYVHIFLPGIAFLLVAV
jgi:hypothetical protein